jgi:hypothetical protein
MDVMRRLAAALACLALSQSAVLATGVLCEGAGLSAPGMPSMPGMARDDAPGADSSAPVRQDRHHDGAHCPFMAGCAAMAVRARSLETPIGPAPVAAPRIARVVAPHSETAAPEPPPPKG